MAHRPSTTAGGAADAHTLCARCRAYKIRDVFEEMDLCGVPPAALTYFRVIFACMKARRLGDTLYYWHRMQRAGIVPDVSAPSPSCNSSLVLDTPAVRLCS